LTPGSRGPCSCRVCPGGEFPDKISRLRATLKNNYRVPEQNYPEKLILDFSRYIVSRINSFEYQKYAIDQEDLLQSIYVRIYKIFKNSDKKRGCSRLYINRIINSVVIDAIKKSRKETEIVNTLNHNMIAVHGHAYEKSKSQSYDLKQILLRSLNELKGSRRYVIDLYLSGLELDEIAQLQKWSKGKTNNLFYRGLKDLKKRLKKRGIFHEN
jgi:RNA polymerase sigma factor (sigma-70 family)